MAENPATLDAGSTGLSGTKTPQTFGNPQEDEIVTALDGYFQEADNARKGGLNPRDAKWEENLNLYWGRHDWSQKADWQSKEYMPEVPQFVDRFAAAMKEALVASQDGFFTVTDPSDKEQDLTSAIKKMTSIWLSRSGRNQMGTLLPFSSTFEEQMKLGALMATSSVVTWKNDVPKGRVAIETTDPRFTWLDPTYRNLYRIRRIEVDKHDLVRMTGMTDAKGKPIYHLDAMNRLVSDIHDDKAKKEQLSGHGHEITSGRSPIQLDEYVATVVDNQGKVIANQALFVVANKKFLIRGPEKNPFWHGSDWLTYAPLVTTPLSVYGRSYMEDFGSVAHTFTELTNLILDAVYMSSLNAFAVVPSYLLNPDQLAGGITGNKMFLMEEGVDPRMFAQDITLGTMSPESLKMWQMLKQELSEAAGINEIGLGQFAPKGRTSATEINQTQQSSSALIRSVAQTVETRYLDVTLDLTWKTGLQHASPDDPYLRNAVGEEMYTALLAERKDLITRPITFQARGISALIKKSQMLKTLLTLLSVVGQNEILMQEFFKHVSPERFIRQLFFLSDINLDDLQMSERDKMVRAAVEPVQAAQQNAEGAPPAGDKAQQEMKSLAGMMGGGA